MNVYAANADTDNVEILVYKSPPHKKTVASRVFQNLETNATSHHVEEKAYRKKNF